MARVRIAVFTTIHGEVTVDQHFDETFATDESTGGKQLRTTCVADAVRRASDVAIAAHGEPAEEPLDAEAARVCAEIEDVADRMKTALRRALNL